MRKEKKNSAGKEKVPLSLTSHDQRRYQPLPPPSNPPLLYRRCVCLYANVCRSGSRLRGIAPLLLLLALDPPHPRLSIWAGAGQALVINKPAWMEEDAQTQTLRRRVRQPRASTQTSAAFGAELSCRDARGPAPFYYP